MRPVLLFLFSYLLGSRAAKPWTPIAWQSIPAFQPSEKVELYYLVAPLMEEYYGSLFAEFDMYHAAIGVVGTNYSFTANYDALISVSGSLFPIYEPTTDGTYCNLTWQNQGAIFLYDGINETYWLAENIKIGNPVCTALITPFGLDLPYLLSSISQSTRISTDLAGEINGAEANAMVAWYPSVNVSHPYYNLMAVWNTWDNRHGQKYVEAYDCMAFAWDNLNWLYTTYGVQFDYTLQLSRNFEMFYSSQAPTAISDEDFGSDPTVRQDICSYYSLLNEFAEGNDAEKILRLLEIYAELLQDEGYTRTDNTYYHLYSKYPYWDWFWFYSPMPGQKTTTTVTTTTE